MKRRTWIFIGILMTFALSLVLEKSRRLVFELADLVYFSPPTLDDALPRHFTAPVSLETNEFRLRPLMAADYRRDHEAVVVSRADLIGFMGRDDSWPEEDLSLLDNYLQLLRHQMEFSRRHTFTYTVESPDGNTTLGCVYIFPARNPDYTVEVLYWGRSGSTKKVFEEKLGTAIQNWIRREWPFAPNKVAFPGRTIQWSDYLETREKVVSN